MMDYVTSGDIARQNDEDADMVRYALRRIGAVPVGRAGIVRLFDASVTEEVRDYLKNRKSRKESKS